jgi:hypothetical protein
MLDEGFMNEVFKIIDLSQLKKRNQQITKQIRKLLKKDPKKKYLFAVGAGYLTIEFLIWIKPFLLIFSSSLWQY